LTKKTQIDFTDKVINYFKSTLVESLMEAGADPVLSLKIVRKFNEHNKDDYKHIRRMIEGKK
jgi:hypothetical protein